MNKHTLIIASVFAPTVSGSTVMTRNLFRHFPPENISVITGSARIWGMPRDMDTDIPCSKVYVDLPAWLDRHRTKYLMVPLIIRKALKVASDFKIDNIFTHWPDTPFVIAAYYVSKILKKPLYFWLHSLWEERDQTIPDYVMTRLFEKRIICYAKHLFVATEAARDFYVAKYGIDSTVLYHSVDFSLILNREIHTAKDEKEEKTILFSGAIYPSMNLDSVQRLVKAVNSIDSYNIRIMLCTSIPKVLLKDWGLLGHNVEVMFVTKPELIKLLDEADILFLPLAFQSDMPLEIETVFPTKTLEYLLSKTPILVHAPPGSYINSYATAKGFGYVIDQPDIDQLRAGIHRLLEDKVLRASLQDGAEKTAKERDSHKIAGTLKEILSE